MNIYNKIALLMLMQSLSPALVADITRANVCSNGFENLVAELNIIESILEVPAEVSPCAATIITQADVDMDGQLNINNSGNYCLSSDIAGAININVSNVTLNLNSFNVAVSINILSGAININASNVIIKNGSVTNSYFGVTIGGDNVTITDLIVTGCLNCGIATDNPVNYLLIKNVMCNGNGIQASFGNGGGGANLNCINSRIENCTFNNNLYNSGLQLNGTNTIIRNCTASNNLNKRLNVPFPDGFNLTDSGGLYCENCVANGNGGGSCPNDCTTVSQGNGFTIANTNSCVMENCSAMNNHGIGFLGVNTGSLTPASTIAGGVLHNCIANNNGTADVAGQTDGFKLIGNNMIIRHCTAENNVHGHGFNQGGMPGAGQYYDNVACGNKPSSNYDPSIATHSPGGVVGVGSGFFAGYNLDCSACPFSCLDSLDGTCTDFAYEC